MVLYLSSLCESPKKGLVSKKSSVFSEGMELSCLRYHLEHIYRCRKTELFLICRVNHEQLKKSISKKLIKEFVIVVVGFIVIWSGLWAYFGTENPFYVVASGSMIPELQVYDLLIIQAHVPIEDIQIGDIIVFDRPSDHDRVIVHRVVSITDDEPRTLRTKGDNNMASIPGTDFPITDNEYKGKVVYQVPQIGYVTQILKPPVNYILIVIVVGFMIFREFYNRDKN